MRIGSFATIGLFSGFLSNEIGVGSVFESGSEDGTESRFEDDEVSDDDQYESDEKREKHGKNDDGLALRRSD